MSVHLEVQRPGEAPELIPLRGERFSLGRSESNDLVIEWDKSVSRLHATLERMPGGWFVKDLESSNGTFVNGKRIWGERPLRPGDEIRVGQTRIAFRADLPVADQDETLTGPRLPELTRREREVLLVLCRPAFSGTVFTEPASMREIAETLVITEAAVKQHMVRLYEKFGIHDRGERRRVRLANEAVRRGAVTVTDLRSQGMEPGK